MAKQKQLKIVNGEIFLEDDTLITSKTDLKGNLIYANDDFINFSGFTEAEILQKPHSIVRHKNMPKVAFKLLWKTLHEGREFFAFVCNVSKSGNLYWVFANVTPSYDANGKMIGYYSVRRRASKAGVQALEPFYKQLVKIEETQGVNAAIAEIERFLKNVGKSWEEMMIDLQKQGEMGGFR